MRCLAIFICFTSTMCTTSALCGSTEIYFNDFEKPVGAEWSHTQTDITPIGGRSFLGQFTNQAVTLTLTDLPAHETISVSFDLFIIRTWDGAAGNPAAGPDRFMASASGSGVLLDTTFANFPGHTQNFPDSTSSGITHPRHTGATEINSLGYSYAPVGPMDSVYSLTLEFEHASADLALTLQGLTLQTVDDESWGIDNISIVIETVPTCPADIAPAGSPPGDGIVNVDDLLALLAAWGPCNAKQPCPADLAPSPTGDGNVNVDDLLALLASWGPC